MQMTKTIYKTVHQYSSMVIVPENMQKLQEIARDYNQVKNYVYQRYGGIGGLSRIYPGYTVQNEMTESGLRKQLGLPSVYFYLAVFEALGDIKAQWSRVKNGVLEAVKANLDFAPEERHYLRLVMKLSGCFESILRGKEISLPEKLQPALEEVSRSVDTERLNRYLCRQVRKRMRRLSTGKTDGFAISERAYRYGNEGKHHGIYVSTKEKRRRLFIPLTDENQYQKQLYIKLKPEQGAVEILAPMQIEVRFHGDYQNEIGLSMGVWRMFITDGGNVYGERLGELHRELAEYIQAGNRTYHRERANNPGRKKYESGKKRRDAALESYINQELNRMLKKEKPGIIFLPKLPKMSEAGGKAGYSVGLWKRGYIRKRLEQKCLENGVELIWVLGKAISTECSRCGETGTCEQETFLCRSCGYQVDRKVNAAQNARKRGQMGQRINKSFVNRSSGILCR